MVMWWVMFRELIPHVLAYLFPINKISFCLTLFFIQQNYMSIALELFCLTVVVTIPSSVELSILIWVGGWVKPISWSVMRIDITIWPFWNIPWILLRSRTPPRDWGFYIPCGLDHFLVVGGLKIITGWLVVISGNSALQCGCMLIGMMHHCQCEVSYR